MKTICLYALKATNKNTRRATRLNANLSQGSNMYSPDVMLYLKCTSSSHLINLFFVLRSLSSLRTRFFSVSRCDSDALA